jgi:hypothetical protein
MDMQAYLKNRAARQPEELEKYRGEWIAWSPDGSRVVASSRDLDALDGLVRIAGEDPAECPIQGIPGEDCVIGGMDAP